MITTGLVKPRETRGLHPTSSKELLTVPKWKRGNGGLISLF